MTKQETARMADQMIGAAQVLDAEAKRLREGATALRKWGLPSDLPLELWILHKLGDLDRAHANAASEIEAAAVAS